MKAIYLIFTLIALSGKSFAQEENPLPFVNKEPEYDIAPEFKGGTKALDKYFADSIRYPEPEKSKGKEGFVSMKFTVTETGKIINAKPLNGVPGAPNFVKESIRLLESMPPWVPATKNNKAVDAEYKMNIPFKLSEEKRERY